MTNLDAIDERWVFYGSLAHAAAHLYVYMFRIYQLSDFVGITNFFILLFCLDNFVLQISPKVCRNTLAVPGSKANCIIVVIQIKAIFE